MLEEWKPVVGYEGLYSVSNLGRVRSEERVVSGKLGSKRTLPQTIRKLQQAKTYLPTPYQNVILRNPLGAKSYYIHRLVALAFIPNLENKPSVNHKDSNPQNNCVDNLEWCTQKENMGHSIDHGRFVYPAPTLVSANKLEAINNMIVDGKSYTQIALKLKVSTHTIRKYFGASRGNAST